MSKHINPHSLIKNLFNLRNQYDAESLSQKRALLEKINVVHLKSKEVIELFYNTLLFLIAYPDNKTICSIAEAKLNEVARFISNSESIKAKLYNSGFAGSLICSQFSFEMVYWLREKYGKDIYLDSITAPDSQVRYIITAVMPQVESEILEDENSSWKNWLNQCTLKGEDLLDTLLKLFDQCPVRPEVKDELWNALAIYVTVRLTHHVRLPDDLTANYYHRSLLKKASLRERRNDKPLKIKLTLPDAEKIIGCARMILVSHTREIDPISFSAPSSVSYYQLSRGISIALLGMRPGRRHPIDCYMGYMVFKNGLPLGYAGSWVLFDSARIGLNIFPAYRGGESMYVFEQILKLHKHVYRLRRFSVDPYQIGKNNSDGIKSGAFWLYYKFGFRHLDKNLRELAESEQKKIVSQKGYRSSSSVLKKLAEGRLEVLLHKQPSVRFDVTDLSLAYRRIVKEKYSCDRKAAEQYSMDQLLRTMRLQGKIDDENFSYTLRNWSVILMANPAAIRNDHLLIAALKKIFFAKVDGNEEEYISLLQQNSPLKLLIEAALV